MRLFVAVNLPAEVRSGLWEAMEPVRRRQYPVRWVDPDGMHITVKFLGDVDDPRESAIRQVLDAAVAGTRAFPLAIGGFGVFPNASRPRVVWAGCEAAPPLELLQHRVEQRLEALGFPLEGRAFRPHVTLGRAKSGAPAGPLASVATALADLEYAAEVTVPSLDLMESRLSPAGV